MNSFLYLIMPSVIVFFGLGCLFSKKDLPSSFLEGAEDGFRSCIGLLPTLVILLTAISMFNASGAAEYISAIISPVTKKLGIPSELTPLLIVRPISGSGSLAMLTDLLEGTGADSFAGKCASVLVATSDTVIYITAVYMSAAGVKKTRHTLPAAFAVMLLGIFLSCITVRIFC